MEKLFLVHYLPINADPRSIISHVCVCLVIIHASDETLSIIDEFVDTRHNGPRHTFLFQGHIPRLVYINKMSVQCVSWLLSGTLQYGSEHPSVQTYHERVMHRHPLLVKRKYQTWLSYQSDILTRITVYDE